MKDLKSAVQEHEKLRRIYDSTPEKRVHGAVTDKRKMAKLEKQIQRLESSKQPLNVRVNPIIATALILSLGAVTVLAYIIGQTPV